MKRLLSLALIFPVSCASITASRTDRLSINAGPGPATVTLNGAAVGAAPMSVEVPRAGNSSVGVSAPGFQRAICDTSMHPGGGYIAADVVLCLLLFPIGCVSFVDAAGAWNELNTPFCNVSLVPEATTHAAAISAPQASAAR